MRTITKRAIQGSLAGALAFSGIAAATGPAQAASTYYKFQNQNTGRCVDDSGDSYSHDLLRAFVCNGTGWQTWRVLQWDSSGYFQIQNVNTGRCLDWSGVNGGNRVTGFPCYQSSFDGGWQKWVFVYRTTAQGRQQLVLKNGYQANGNYCLDDSGDASHDVLRAYPCNGSSQDGLWQGWNVTVSS